MDNNNVPGGKTYGVIRTDQEGIRYLKFCVEDVLIDFEPLEPTIPIQAEATTYSSFWWGIECSKEDI
jgi:hypothetical protein